MTDVNFYWQNFILVCCLIDFYFQLLWYIYVCKIQQLQKVYSILITQSYDYCNCKDKFSLVDWKS